MRALITGGGGFIGSHLAKRLLREGYAVDLLDDFSRGRHDRDLSALLADPDVRLLERNLLREDSLHDVPTDYRLVFHLAAIVGVANVMRAPYRVLDENVRLLSRVLEFARTMPHLERLVFASTSEVYAGTLEQGTLAIPTPEDTPITLPALDRPRTSYLLSKIYGEALCLQSGLPTTVIRPHNVYGPRMGLAHVIPELLERANRAPDGGRLEVFSVEHRRTFCYVEDAVELIARAAQSAGCAGEVINVGAQSPEVAIRDLAETVIRVVGKDLAIDPLPPTPGSPTRRCPDMSKAAALTGYTARVGLDDGVRSTYEWYAEHAFSVAA